MKLREHILRQIAASGPLTIAEYMALALTHPEHGYYTTKTPFGREGDFTTAPEISQIFGELIGIWCAHQWQSAGGGKIALVELGPGRGTLMKDALRATRHVPGFHAAIQIHLVEVSQKLEQLQRETLAGAHLHIHWHRDISSLPQEKPWLVVANEFMDALPIRQFTLRGGKPYERCVGERGGELCLMEVPVDLPPALSELYEGEITEWCEPAEAVITFLASHIKQHGGAALMVDYGYTTPVRGDTLQAVKKHQFHDVLTAPGEADITAHINFLRLADVASANGAQAFLSTQGHFLLRLGAAERAERLAAQNDKALAPAIYSGVQRLVADDAMGALFKLMAITASNEAPPGF